MKLKTIFNEIVHVMNNDYAGRKDKKGCDQPKKYLRKIEADEHLSKEAFKQIVEDYLLDFNDSHIHFRMKNAQDGKAKFQSV